MGLLTWEQHYVFPWLILCKNLINCISQQHNDNCSEYWHKVLLWFFSASFFDLRKEKSTLPYWLPVLCSKAVVHSSVVTACNTQTTCKEMALQHLLLLTGQFPSLLCHLHPSKTKSANKCHSMRLASMDLSPQGA